MNAAITARQFTEMSARGRSARMKEDPRAVLVESRIGAFSVTRRARRRSRAPRTPVLRVQIAAQAVAEDATIYDLCPSAEKRAQRSDNRTRQHTGVSTIYTDEANRAKRVVTPRRVDNRVAVRRPGWEKLEVRGAGDASRCARRQILHPDMTDGVVQHATLVR